MKTIIFAIVLLAGTFAQARPEWRYEVDNADFGTYTEQSVKGFGKPHSYLYQGVGRIQFLDTVVTTNDVVDFETGITNLNVVATNYPALPINLCRWIPTDLLPRKATQAELDEVATAIAQAQILAETTRQEAKSDSLKAVENNFLALCDSLTSTTSHTKLTFAQIAAIGDAMTDQALHISIAIQLLSIDAEGKTLGGLSWWYDCAWHPEIIEAE